MTKQIDELMALADEYALAKYRFAHVPSAVAEARAALEAALKPDPSCDDVKLAEMIMSDCGHSTNNTRLLERITNRIALHTAPPAQTPRRETEQSEPACYQYQDRDGQWCNFVSEKHYEDTKLDGNWPIRALYTAPPLREPLSDQWQPIETAPKDSSSILIYTPNSQHKVREAWWAIPYEGSLDGYWSTPVCPNGRGYTILPSAATHWMPLPAPPDTGEKT
jgi:hypothetical protein